MELFINKISHYLPDSVVPNSYFKEVNGLDDEWIYSRTGIKNRSKAAANENTNTMGIKAVDLATTDLPYPMEEIDLIIAATYSPYDTVATPLSHRARQMCECFLSLFFFYQCDGNCTRLFCSGESDQSPDHRSRTQHSLCQRKRSAKRPPMGRRCCSVFCLCREL